MNQRISRRNFLKRMAGFAVALLGLVNLSPLKKLRFLTAAFAREAPSLSGKGPDLVVAEKGTPEELLKKALSPLGGIERFVKKGNFVVVKPNVAWARTPGEAANTNPRIVEALIKICYLAGAGRVVVRENPCNDYKFSFPRSGIEEAVKRAGGKMRPAVRKGDFRKVDVPRGKILKSTEVIKDVLQADVFINVPVAKHHSSTGLTLSMKNLMGVVQDRGYFHRSGLHQCIADLSTLIKPDLVIMDATRILTTNGPQGPGEVKKLDKIIAGIDPVAIDSYGATLFGLKGEDLGYVQKASEMKLGEIDLKKLRMKVVA